MTRDKKNPPEGASTIADALRPFPGSLSPTSAALERLDATLAHQTDDAARTAKRIDRLRSDMDALLTAHGQFAVETRQGFENLSRRLEALAAEQVAASRRHAEETAAMKSVVIEALAQQHAHLQTLATDHATAARTQIVETGALRSTLLETLAGHDARVAALADEHAAATRTQAEQTAAMRSAMLETLAQHDVRRELRAEKELRNAFERRRIEDLNRIRQLAEDRDALEIELQANAARHRREISRLKGAPSSVPGAAATVPPAAAVDQQATFEPAPSAPTAASPAPPSPSPRLSKAERKGLHAEARAAMRSREWAKAEPLYARLVADQARRPALWKQYAHAAKEGGNLALAESAYFRSLSLAPGDADTALHIAHVLKNRGDREHAVFVFNGILATHPGHRAAREGLGDLGHALPPTGPDAYPAPAAPSRLQAWLKKQRIRSAGAAAGHRDWRRAATRYADILKEDPYNTRLLIQMGHALKESGRTAEAEAAYRKAIEVEPLNSDAHLHLGHVLKLGGHTEASMASYRTALRCWPENEDARHELQDA